MTNTNFPSTLSATYAGVYPERSRGNADNNLTSKTDRKGQTIQYVYDALNRLTQKSYPDATSANYVYDLVGKVQSVNDPTGSYGFAYDNMGRLVGTTTSYSFLTARTFTTSYAYDAASNRMSFTDPENGTTSYSYDTLNRLQTLAPPAAFGAGSFGFSYDALSRRTQMTRPNGISTNYSYDSLSRLLTVLHQAGGSTIDGAVYTVDAAGNRTSKADQLAAVTSNYAYDAIYQLTQVAQGANTTESYSYDPVGNRLSSLGVSPYSYNPSNEMVSTSTAMFVYDANGNMTSKTDSTGATQYTWDFENRLASVTLPGTGGTITFKYDPLGRRIYRSSSSGTSVFAYDGDNLIEETNAAGAVVARYSQTQTVDEPLAMLRSSTTSYYQADALGSVSSLSNTAGALANTYTYDSFGNLTASSGSLTNPFRYTGREFDTETNLYFYRARYFDQSVGRFLSEDPSSFFSGSLNFYEYVENSPLGFKDPNGLQAQGGAAPCCDKQKIKDGLRQLQQALNGPKAAHSAIFQKYKPCLQKLAGDLDIKCGPPLASTPPGTVNCGYHSPYSPGAIVITPQGSSGGGGCGPVKATIAHEMVHSCYENDLSGPNLSSIDQEKQAFGLECQLFGINCACARDPKKCGY